MAEASQKKPWYEMGLGIRASPLYLMLRFLPGALGVDPYAAWINHLRNKNMEDTLAKFDRLVADLDEGSIVLDGGANLGNVTARLAETGAHVHSFEPEPELFGLLKKRFSDTPNVTLHNVALAARAGMATLRIQREVDCAPTTFDGHSIVDGWGRTSDEKTIQIKCIDFFDFVSRLGKKPALIKMDIEGAEVEILERLIAEDRLNEIGPMFVELHDRQIRELRRRTVNLFRQLDSRDCGGVNLLWP